MTGTAADGTMSATLTGADRVARRLTAAGATHAFGIPGGEVLALVAASIAAAASTVMLTVPSTVGVTRNE